MTEVHAGTQLGEPTASPDPTAGNRVEDGANKQFAKKEGPEGDPLANRANDNVAGSLHKHDFEERQAVAAGIVRWASQEKPLASQESPLAASDQEMI